MGHGKTIRLLMGPTGSGKSAYALRLAALQPTVIINADAMQLVDTLRVLTARPSIEEEQQAEHALYGVLKPQEPTSVARWLALVAPVIRAAWAEGKQPLIVGGTGMYIKALMEGLAEVPEIPAEVRAKVRDWGLGIGDWQETEGSSPTSLTSNPQYPIPNPSLHERLAARDPEMAARLKPGDTQRLLRALEVWEATGKSLGHWQAQTGQPLFPDADYVAEYMALPRAEMYRRIDARFEGMMARGALDEVRALLALDLPPDMPILRAHGVPELAAYLRGEMTLEAAIAQAQQHTRNYAKRQMTWIRNQLPDAVPITL